MNIRLNLSTKVKYKGKVKMKEYSSQQVSFSLMRAFLVIPALFSMFSSVVLAQGYNKADISIHLYDNIPAVRRVVVAKEEKITLEDKYKNLAGRYYYEGAKNLLPIIDKVLVSEGLDDNSDFIKVMFFVGEYESHWNPNSVSGSAVGSEHPTGIFQFLPSTFRTVSRGDIFDTEDQLYAFVNMMRADRLDEFGTIYLPMLEVELREKYL